MTIVGELHRRWQGINMARLTDRQRLGRVLDFWPGLRRGFGLGVVPTPL